MKHWRQILSIAGLAVFFTFLSVNAYLGSYSRFIADDYCSAAYGNSRGVIGGALYLYTGWTGRFFANLLDTLMGPLGVRITPFIPALVLAIWLVPLVALLYLFVLAAQNRIRFMTALLLAVIFLSATLIVTPNVVQSLYWEQGMHSVIPPLILGTAFAGLILYCIKRSPRNLFIYIGIGSALVFVAGGFSETYSAVQALILAISVALILIMDRSVHKRTLLFMVCAGFFFSILSMAIMIAAPGNKIRQEGSPAPPGLVMLIAMATNSMERYLGGIMASPVKMLSLAGLAAFFVLLGAGKIMGAEPPVVSTRRSLQIFLGLPPLILILFEACFAPAAYGMSNPPPDRTNIIPTYILISGLAIWGMMAGQLSRIKKGNPQSRAMPYLKVVVLSVCVLFTLNTIRLAYLDILRLPEFRSYAIAWDRIDQTIRQAKMKGESSILVPSLANPAGLQQLSENPDWWVNYCISQYYGITVTADYSLK